ncbi:MAG: hypothetical protein JWM88_3385 [Verrucomicrobia bacterium]|nr:hypothetical protein [Verrucomicrobiota bacterium]
MKRLLIFLLILSTALFAGCKHFRKNRKPKETTAVATDVEETLRQRWMEKRTAELVAQGLRVDIARQQAIDEFQARYSYLHSANK